MLVTSAQGQGQRSYKYQNITKIEIIPYLQMWIVLIVLQLSEVGVFGMCIYYVFNHNLHSNDLEEGQGHYRGSSIGCTLSST